MSDARPMLMVWLLFGALIVCPSSAAMGEENVFTRLHKLGFSLQRALSGPDGGEGATFNYSDSKGTGGSYNAELALSWTLPQPPWEAGAFQLSPSSSAEARVTTDEMDQTNDAIRFRLSLDADTGRDVPPGQRGSFDSTFTQVSVKFESDERFLVQKLMFETVFTPTARSLAMGRARPREGPIQFIWRPFLGLDVGHTIKAKDPVSDEDPVFRLVPRIRGRLLFNSIAHALRLSEVALFADSELYLRPLEDKAMRSFTVAGIEFLLTDYISLQTAVKVGYDAPTFKYGETLNLGFGLKF
jgi:hypothetical protein